MSVVKTETLGLIPPEKIVFDKKNPRGEMEKQILEDEDFAQLRKSVKHNGLFIPVIVRPNKDKKQPYRLVDGERRLGGAVFDSGEVFSGGRFSEDKQVLVHNEVEFILQGLGFPLTSCCAVMLDLSSPSKERKLLAVSRAFTFHISQ